MCRLFGTLCSIFIGCVNNNNNFEEITKVFIQVRRDAKSLGQASPSNLVPVILFAAPMKMEQTEYSETSTHKIFRSRGITQNKGYNIQNANKV